MVKNQFLRLEKIAIEKKNIDLEAKLVSLKKDIYRRDSYLNEINHRVNNNLQLVSSLLNIHAKEYDSRKAGKIFNKGYNRLNAILLLHENFDIKEAAKDVDLNDYINEMFSFILEAFNKNQDDYAINIETNNIKLNFGTAVPLGLVINELLCNSVFHAFPNKDSNKSITINIRQLSSDRYLMTFSDNGIGFNKNSSKKTKGMGLKIIDMIKKQVQGNILILNTKSGTKIEFSFSPKC